MKENTFGYLLSITPPSWDFRGSPYLWNDIKQTLLNEELPNTFEEAFSKIADLFEKCTGKKIDCGEDFGVQKYAHGGMSSGGISANFWNTKLKGFLQKSFQYLKNPVEIDDSVKKIMEKENKDIAVLAFSNKGKDVFFLYDSNAKSYNLNLPIAVIKKGKRAKKTDYYNIVDKYDKDIN